MQPAGDDTYFCSNLDCPLHVPLREGCQWAEIDGVWFDRLPMAGRFYCSRCRRELATAQKHEQEHETQAKPRS